MKAAKKYTLLFMTLFLLIITGYIRDFTFININYRLSQLYYSTVNFELPASLSVFSSLSYNQLYYTKFFLTLFFIILFLAYSLICVKLLFPGPKFLRYTITAHAAVFILSVLFFIYGYFFNDYARGYSLSRIFAGFLQSPLLLMLLIPAFKLGSMQPASGNK